MNIAFDFKARAYHAVKNRVALSTSQRREIEHDIAGQQPAGVAAVKKKHLALRPAFLALWLAKLRNVI